jgi:hypothetical protein
MITKLILLFALGLTMLIMGLSNLFAHAEPVKTCPAGSYDVGISKTNELLCKLEPTGCPYGDSIPIGAECDKFNPKDYPPIIETTTYTGGGK